MPICKVHLTMSSRSRLCTLQMVTAKWAAVQYGRDCQCLLISFEGFDDYSSPDFVQCFNCRTAGTEWRTYWPPDVVFRNTSTQTDLYLESLIHSFQAQKAGIKDVVAIQGRAMVRVRLEDIAAFYFNDRDQGIVQDALWDSLQRWVEFSVPAHMDDGEVIR